MEIWTVVYVQESDVMPFVHSFRSHEAAIKAVEENAKEDYDATFEPDQEHLPFEGVEWNEDKTTAFLDVDDSDAGYWVVQRTEVE